MHTDTDDLGEDLGGNKDSWFGESVQNPAKNAKIEQAVGKTGAPRVEQSFEREFQAEPEVRA
ncbi:MAG: hypothetical protein ABR82_00540 [Verrucomicrobia subdivision 6 bacterium BACL9 MAG-120507-bin52]|uniref:Uncharacterized protein n=1 Tax=Verrucomicrobia subdivision 6 bacterium BACL9 MAG-120507-bin52 TaxID=1655590 RepID=A0A0R2RQI7_9BACT|nr:MAG: hypothetical protein ABR82_00540 [Verrucomicrobia subdivision 6 bacterium BACL9 MAG-120507-bin52]